MPATVGAVCVCVAEMRMCSGGMPVALLGESLGRVGDFARNHAAIADGEGDVRRAVVEHQAAGVQPIVHRGRLPIGHAAVDGDRELQPA